MRHVLSGIRGAFAVAVTGLSVTAGPAVAQDVDAELLGRCEAAGLASPFTRNLCRDVATALEIMQPEAGMLLAGGNPVLGTFSPVGTRFRFIPRVNVGARVNIILADVPDVVDYPDAVGSPIGGLDFPVPMGQLDLSIGVFDGFQAATTLGGLLSVELLGSLSTIILPSGEGFVSDATGYGVGARIGIIRESFTAPGISVSAMYKWMDRFQLGDLSAGDDAQFGADLRVLSARAGISKSFLILNVAAGLGVDRYSSDVDFAVRSPLALAPVGDPLARIDIATEEDPADLTSTRWSGFVDVSYVLLFFNIVGEVGWQETEALNLSTGDEVESGSAFGAIGIRLSL